MSPETGQSPFDIAVEDGEAVRQLYRDGRITPQDAATQLATARFLLDELNKESCRAWLRQNPATEDQHE